MRHPTATPNANGSEDDSHRVLTHFFLRSNHSIFDLHRKCVAATSRGIDGLVGRRPHSSAGSLGGFLGAIERALKCFFGGISQGKKGWSLGGIGIHDGMMLPSPPPLSYGVKPDSSLAFISQVPVRSKVRILS